LDENLSGLSRISREQALELYREKLFKLVLHELEALGGWNLRSARFTLEKDPYSELLILLILGSGLLIFNSLPDGINNRAVPAIISPLKIGIQP